MQAAETFPLGTQLTVPVQNDLLILDKLRPYLYTTTGGEWARINRHLEIVESKRTLFTSTKGTGISPDGFLFGHQGVSNYSAFVMMDAYSFGIKDGIGSSSALFSLGFPFSCRDDTIQNFGHQQALIHPILGQVVYDIGFGGQITALFYQGQLPTCYAEEPHPGTILAQVIPLGILGFGGALNSSLIFGLGYSSCVDKHGSLWVTSGYSVNDTDYGLSRMSLGLFQGLGSVRASVVQRHWILNGYLKRGNNGIMYDAAAHQLIIFGQDGTADDVPITSLTRTSNTVTAVVPGHGRSVNDVIGIRGTTDVSFHGVFQVVSIIDGNNLTYAQEAADGSALLGELVPYPQGIAKWDIATERFTGVSYRYGADTFMESEIRAGVKSDGTFIISAGGVTRRFLASDLSVLAEYNLNNWSSTSRFGWVYDAEINALWVIQAGGKVQPYYLERAATSQVTLASIVQDLCLMAGLQLADIDTSQLNSINVRGYVVGLQGSVKSAIEPLMSAYFFNPRERDGKIEFILRGGAPVVTIEERFLGAASEPSARVAM
ncbi:MAG: phage tail protein, partial [bacterium]